eukprot:5467185-Pyramimonas_sp.AAC.1
MDATDPTFGLRKLFYPPGPGGQPVLYRSSSPCIHLANARDPEEEMFKPEVALVEAQEASKEREPIAGRER